MATGLMSGGPASQRMETGKREGGGREGEGNKFSLENEKCTGHGANELNFTSFAKFTARKSRRD